jgi:AraC-like DNA-binding protein
MFRTIQTIAPRRELREFVHVFALRLIPNGTCTSQANVATIEQAICFYLDGETYLNYPAGHSKLAPNINVFGAMTFPCGGARFAGNVKGFAMFLKPLALTQLFGVPGAELVNKDCDGRALLGNTIDDLFHSLHGKATFEEQVRAAEEFLLPLSMSARSRSPVMRTASHIVQKKGIVRIDDLANDSGLSLRHYERRFSEDIGISPKLFARITRFQRALDAKRLGSQRSWLSIAHELAYSDQMHMVKDFQKLSGESPAQILMQSGDLQPWSVASGNVVKL